MDFNLITSIICFMGMFYFAVQVSDQLHYKKEKCWKYSEKILYGCGLFLVVDFVLAVANLYIYLGK